MIWKVLLVFDIIELHEDTAMNMCRQSIWLDIDQALQIYVAAVRGWKSTATYVCKASLYEWMQSIWKLCYNNKVVNISTSSKASTMIVTSSYFSWLNVNRQLLVQ